MNRKFVFHLFGRIVQIVGGLMLAPTLVSLIYGEKRVFWSFLITVAAAFALGTLIERLCRTNNKVIYAKDGFAIVSLAWLGMSAIGAIPFAVSGEIPSYVDAFFETVSGFTTTGATILSDVEVLSRGLLFWRSFAHWIGGMGVLVFVMAIVSNISDRSIHIMRAEMPGPSVGKLVPRAKDTAKILYLIYIVLTFAEIIMLCIGGMPIFDSVLHSFGTAGTGGFGIKADSIGGYSNYCQMVIAVFMLIFGMNFNLFYLLLLRRFRSVMRSTELWVYLGIVTVAVSAISVNLMPIYNNVADSIRYSLFQVSSVITTTGYATTDFNMWPGFSKGILMLLGCIGACAGSTAGGLKMSRVVILAKQFVKEIRRMIHPRSVNAVKFEGKALDDPTLSSVSIYMAAYVVCVVAVFLAVSYEPFGFETNFSAVLATFNNVGPGFGDVGPAGNFSQYSDVSKLVFSLAMLLGRLEIFPLIIALSPSTWRKKQI